MEKVENLRRMIGKNGVTYHELERLTFRNEEVPSIASLRKYDLLKIMRTENIEEEMTVEEWDNNDMQYDYHASEWNWNEQKGTYVYHEEINYYGIK